MGILNIDINNISLDDNFDEDDPDTIILLWDFWLGILNFKKCKELKKELSEELMPLAWHPDTWWDWWMSEDEKKEIDPMFIQEL